MSKKSSKKTIIFGAGKNNFSFIPKVFYNSDYVLVFLNTGKNPTDILNSLNEHTVTEKEEVEKKLEIPILKAFQIDDQKYIPGEVVATDKQPVSARQGRLFRKINVHVIEVQQIIVHKEVIYQESKHHQKYES